MVKYKFPFFAMLFEVFAQGIPSGMGSFDKYKSLCYRDLLRISDTDFDQSHQLLQECMSI